MADLIEFGSPIISSILKTISKKADPKKSPEDVKRGIAYESGSISLSHRIWTKLYAIYSKRVTFQYNYLYYSSISIIIFCLKKWCNELS